MIKKCEICGKEFQTIPNGGARKYCFDCVPHGLDFGQRTICKRQAAKHEGVRRLGGHCLKCGETREHILSFHHLDEENKIANPSQLLADSKITEFFEEINKCVLLCNNCHGDYHFLHNNIGITLEDYIGHQITREEFYDSGIKEQIADNQPQLSKLQQIQAQQGALKKPVKHIYQGKVIAYKDAWIKEFNSVKECVEYFAQEVLQDIESDNISDGIRRVLNGKRKTYHGYSFVKDE